MKKHNHFCKMKILLLLIFVPTLLLAQETITGKVVVEGTGQGAPFMNIIEEGTDNGTSSDIDGNFSITVSSLPVNLKVFALGFAEKTVPVATAGNITIQVAESTESLEEVVVTGLGSSIKRSNAANAVSTVSSEELVGNTGQTTVDGALYGKVPGVNITSSSGAPGGGFALRLRGISSISGNNQPLFIIDGVYINNTEIPSGLRFASGANRGNEENSGNRLADLDPSDIENIEVLKGASAAAIYGQRGNAGVVIITTKRGKGGKTKISFNQDVGFTTIIKKLGVRPWTASSVEAAFGTSERQRFENVIATRGELYDYEDEIYGETGFITDTKISAAGGNEKTKFYVGGSYRDEAGIIQKTGFDRISLRTNIDHKISDVFSISTSSNYVRSNSSRSFTGNENEGGLSFGYNLAYTRPWTNLFPDAAGNYPDNPDPSANGNMLLVRDLAKNEDSNNRFIQGLKLDVKLLNSEKNRLKFVLNGGVDFLANETFVYVPEIHQAQRGDDNGFIGVGKNNFTNFNMQAIGIWNHNAMNGDLGFTTQIGTTYLEQQTDLVFNQTTQLILGQTNLSQGFAQNITQNAFTVKEFGYFFQTEANYKDQIIGTVGYRIDKSTLNGDADKFYGFPKASLAVNLANFDFWQTDKVNQFKLRAAYGQTGNSAAFGSAFTGLNAVSVGGNGGTSIDGQLGDPNIKPETSSEFEVGFDIKMFDKVSLEATYYNREVKDLLLSRNLPSTSGFTRETKNFADLVNSGVEVSLNVDAFDSDNFYWNSGVQFWLNRSEITRLDIPAFAQPGAGFGLGLGSFYIEEGKPVTQIVGNINGTPTQVGDVEPDFQMSFTNQLTFFKQWDLSFLLHWKEGGNNLNLTRLLADLAQTSVDLDTQEGQDRVAQGFVATRFIEPAGYVRLREAALHYRFPTKIVKWLGDGVSGVKLGVSGRNLFTITDYSSYDPEVSVNGGSGLSSGLEVTPFPSTKQYYFHLSVNF
ncbi:membrane protein [Aquimarina atlantica]|uniref:Membrane protein n=1 Tax=Aquimarina atlantica TaxID=1317122 RepID=A0A023BQC6_9FLAO|nr:SusC/RagA family TonB-linked outer membrane protein [Aquimarina atlantica]EZH71893.1 membrane protein [Aquimarina atlantica]